MIRPRLLYFLVYKTADPNFWKMGKKIKSENRIFYIYFIPDRFEKGAKDKKNEFKTQKTSRSAENGRNFTIA